MAHIEWDEVFSVGNETIDRQHRKWIELYNTFDRLMTESNSVESNGLKLDALQLMHEYTLYHFRYEESFMAKLSYPELPQHWRLHKDFDYKVFAYIRKLETGRLVSKSEILDMLREWLLNHLIQEDSRLRFFLESKQKITNDG